MAMALLVNRFVAVVEGQLRYCMVEVNVLANN